jgi:hypothetical protein
MGLTLTASSGKLENRNYYVKTKTGVALQEVERDSLLKQLSGMFPVGIVGYTEPFEIATEYGQRTKLNLLFQVLDGPYKGQRFDLMFGYSVHEKAKLTEIIKAVRGRGVEQGEAFDLDSLLNAKLQMIVVTEQNAKGYDTIYYKGAMASGDAAPPPASATPVPDEFDPFEESM